ncbi:ABC transporter [Couchioplanes caeruleus subsp. caeruleus]|uniref:ABC transporter n=6 Tax=Couchioplanes caeruleus TaxID=56438 RepID=A0A1K0GU14_9ACTN|nr:ABC transporter [Couchioplanes caeruleus subsp. caeruleus]
MPMAYALRHRTALAVIALLDVALAAVAAALPWPAKLAVDSALRGEDLPGWAAWLTRVPGLGTPAGMLALLAAASVVLVAARSVLAGVQRVMRRTAGQRMSADLAMDVLDRLQRGSLARRSARPTGDLVQRVLADTRCVDTLALGVLLAVFQAATALTVMAVIMWGLDPLLTVVSLAVGPALLLAARGFAGSMTRNATREADALGDVMTSAERMLSAVPEIQSFTAEERELRRFAACADRQVAAGLRVHRTALLYQLTLGGITAAGTAVVLALAALATLRATLSVGDLIIFTAYVAALYSPLESTAHLGDAVARARAGTRRVVEVLESTQDVPQRHHPVTLPPAGHGSALVFDGVVFGYQPGRPVLHDISLHVEAGETVALVGPTGAGKSTLLSLVPRFFDPWAGHVFHDGVDVRLARLHQLRSRVSVVRQQPLLLPVSVAENIAYGRPDASRRDVEHAARHALADDFIEALPEGYDTVLGEHGSTLSGGQQQRLAIARALLKDAPVLILDEPTAALDPESEAALVTAVARAAAGRTVLVIAHRLSTVRGADRIVVLDAGRIIEHGTHTELLTTGGTYARYHHLNLIGGRGEVR